MRLDEIAGRAGLPETLEERATFAAIAAAGALIGFGVILFVAANWQDIGTFGRFALVGAVTIAAGVVAMVFERARPAAALTGILGTGGLLALYGQTFQTGADPWQLFALWTLLALPWALAARNDAVWVLVVIVAATALGLWLTSTLAPPGRLGRADRSQHIVSVVLTAWAIVVLFTVPLCPDLGLERLLGRTRWAFRLAVVLAVPLVTAYAMPGLTGRSGSSLLEVAGFLLLAGTLAALAMSPRFDLALAAVVVLGIDALAMAHSADALSSSRGGFDTGPLLAIGIAWAAIFGLSAAGLMRLARERGALPDGIVGGGAGSWPVTVLSGLGALFAALPFLAVLGLTFAFLLRDSGGFLLLGVPILAASVAVTWAGGRSLFMQQLAFIGLVVGLALVTFALARDLGTSGGSLAMLLLVTGLAVVTPRATVSLLGGTAAVFAAIVVADGIYAMFLGSGVTWTILLVAAAATMLALAAFDDTARNWRDSADAYLGGWTAVSLLAALSSSGPTFLGGGFGGKAIGRAGHALWTSSLPVTLTVTPLRVAAVVVTSAALALVWRRWPALASRTARASRTAVAVAVTALVASFLMPIIAGPLAVAAAAMVTGRRVTAIAAAIAALWIAGTFYYWFGLPLTTKAAILVALGLAIAAAVLLDGGEVVPAGDVGAYSGTPVSRNTALIGLALAAAVGVVGLLAAERREVVTTGRTVFVELAPVDPRSLIQGDYMALQFRLPRVRIDGGSAGRVGTLTGLATIDARGIATVGRIVASPAERRAGEHVVRLTTKAGRLILGTDAFYFREGAAARYEKARYGMFRLAADGRAVLVGLADDDLKPLD